MLSAGMRPDMVQTRGAEQEEFIRMNGLNKFGDSNHLKQMGCSRKRKFPWSQSFDEKKVIDKEFRAKSEVVDDQLLSILQAENFLNLENIQKSFVGQVNILEESFPNYEKYSKTTFNERQVKPNTLIKEFTLNSDVLDNDDNGSLSTKVKSNSNICLNHDEIS